MSLAVLVGSLTIYAIVLVLALYFCLFADPDESPTALFLTETLPRKAWTTLEKVLGNKSLSVVEFFLDRLLLVGYCVVVFGAWSIIFAYVYPWLDADDRISVYHKYLGYAVFGACITSWRVTCRTSPGTITARNIKRYDHFPYDNLMFVPGQICKTRNIPRLARSKFDRYKYRENVPRFDHFCAWVHNTIGEENYIYFLIFLAVHVGMCAYGSYIVGHLFYGEILDKNLLEVTFFDRYTGEEITASKYIVFQYLFNRHLMEAGVLAIMGVMFLALGLFLFYHILLTSRGLTTNEAYKWDQVKKWHKRELKRYNDAVKKGEVVVASKQLSDTNRPVVTDGDVTCTPGGGNNNSSNDNEQAPFDLNAIVDPGPEPVNIYNRGFIENWKEVIFPLSLRNVNVEVAARGNLSARATKPKAT